MKSKILRYHPSSLPNWATKGSTGAASSTSSTELTTPGIALSGHWVQHWLQPVHFEATKRGTSKRTSVMSRIELVAAGIALPFYPTTWVGGVRPEFGDPILTWIFLRNVVMLGLYGWTVYFEVELARRFSRIGERLTRVDLLDLTPLRPFARRGLRSVLLWVVLSVLISLLFLAPWSSEPAGGFLALVFVLAAALLLLPAWGVHRRILAAKQAELARVREAMRVGRQGLLASAEATPPGRLADLVAPLDAGHPAGGPPFNHRDIFLHRPRDRKDQPAVRAHDLQPLAGIRLLAALDRADTAVVVFDHGVHAANRAVLPAHVPATVNPYGYAAGEVYGLINPKVR